MSGSDPCLQHINTNNNTEFIIMEAALFDLLLEKHNRLVEKNSKIRNGKMAGQSRGL